MMRHYIPSWDAIGIKRERYLELLHFCRQYPDWKAEAASLLGVHGQAMDGMPHGSTVGDPVAAIAARRERLTNNIEIVDSCAASVEGGRWYPALIQNVCMGRSYSTLSVTVLPNSNRNSFFNARKEFFLALDMKRSGDSV